MIKFEIFLKNGQFSVCVVLEVVTTCLYISGIEGRSHAAGTVAVQIYSLADYFFFLLDFFRQVVFCTTVTVAQRILHFVLFSKVALQNVKFCILIPLKKSCYACAEIQNNTVFIQHTFMQNWKGYPNNFGIFACTITPLLFTYSEL